MFNLFGNLLSDEVVFFLFFLFSLSFFCLLSMSLCSCILSAMLLGFHLAIIELKVLILDLSRMSDLFV